MSEEGGRMSVVRYNFANARNYCCGCGEVEDDSGEYVEYADYQKLLDENASLRAGLEREQMRLVACGVVAMANTPDTAAKARDILPEYRSASCDDVARIVDENMKLHAAIDRLREDSHDAHEALRKELENLRGEVRAKHTDWELEHAEVVKLRAAIGRVRKLHSAIQTTRYGMPMQGCKRCYDEDGFCMPYPCPTLRILDGEGA